MINKCSYYMIARLQRQTEVKRDEGLEGTKSYEEKGCFSCQGYNKKCPAYYPSGITRSMEDNRRSLAGRVKK